jgi:hypothetical protein
VRNQLVVNDDNLFVFLSNKGKQISRKVCWSFIVEYSKKSLENKKEVEMTNSSNSTAREKLLLERKKKKEESLKAKAPKKIEKNENSSPTIEERKKSLEEKKKKILEARKAKLDAKKISKDSTFTKN